MSNKIDENTSVYLDFMRTVAAFIVFLDHTHNFLLPEIRFGPLAWGREAVAVFFVLSGFVISYVVSEKEDSWRSYAAARAARIFPVAVLAIFVTLVADSIGTFINGAHYELVNQAFNGFYHPFTLSAALSYLTFTNQIWFSHIVLGTDEPYWSLGFEAQYYIFFMLLSFSNGRRRAIYLLLWALFCGPKILAYLPLWLLGVAAKRLVFGNYVKSFPAFFMLLFLSLLSFLLPKIALTSMVSSMYKTGSLSQEIVNFVYFTGIGLSIALNIVAMNFIFSKLPRLHSGVARGIRWVAGGSFTLYIAHQPILVMASAILAQFQHNTLVSVAAAFLVLITVYILAELVERRKKIYLTFFRRIFRSEIRVA